MFDAIAPRYDLLNAVLSLGVDRAWRRRAVHAAVRVAPGRILDVATGTADLALALKRAAPDAEVRGVDFAEAMLEVGRAKARRRGLDVRLDVGDGMDLDVPDAAFDVVTIAFGLRNFADVGAGLREFRRVLRPGGRLVVLEFSRPRTFPIKQLYAWYSRHVLPRIGGTLSPDAGAYEYLPNSVAEFPDGTDFLDRMNDSGFAELLWEPLTFGIASLYRGTVPQ